MSGKLVVTEGTLAGSLPDTSTFACKNTGELSGVATPQTWDSFQEARTNASQGIFGRVKAVESGCWEWQGVTNNRGYGRVAFGGRLVLAHRAVYALFNGALSDDVQVCHSCDNPICVNPMHLTAGTRGDNYHDSKAKGRSVIDRLGSQHCASKITEEDVVDIRTRRAKGEAYKSIAATYGLTGSNIRAICKGGTWTHVPLQECPRIGRSSGRFISDSEIMSLRRRWAEGVPARELRAEYGLKEDNFYAITAGRSYKHLPLVKKREVIRG